MVEGAVPAAVSTAPATIGEVGAREHEQPGGGVGVTGVPPSAGPIVGLARPRIQSGLDRHALIVGVRGAARCPRASRLLI